jgi:FMN phosphatase YigB (HAD superfamily)
MLADRYIKEYEAFIFDLDNVIIPERDFLLQVYYLFAQFMEYSEQLNAQELIDYMKIEYETAGSVGIFEKTAARFEIPDLYKENFELLHRNAKLPLKLLLYAPMMQFMQNLLVNGKQMFLLVSGDPERQLNKIRQVEWGGLEQHLRVYFAEEIAPKPSSESLEFVIERHHLQRNKTLVVGLSLEDEQMAEAAGIKYIEAGKLFVN